MWGARTCFFVLLTGFSSFLRSHTARARWVGQKEKCLIELRSSLQPLENDDWKITDYI